MFRASKALSDLVHKFIHPQEWIEAASGYTGVTKSRIPVKPEHIEQLHIAGDDGWERRQLYSYPATSQVRRCRLTIPSNPH
jgi:hypothetical protein